MQRLTERPRRIRLTCTCSRKERFSHESDSPKGVLGSACQRIARVEPSVRKLSNNVSVVSVSNGRSASVVAYKPA